MAELVYAVPGDLAQPTGGYAYARHVMAHLGEYGVRATLLRLPASFPDPSAADLAEAERLLAATPPDAVLLVDGLAYGALPADLLRRLHRREDGGRRPIVALVHHPLALETGLAPERADRLAETERDALGLADWVIASSDETVRVLAEDYDVPPTRLTVAEPGTEPAHRARGSEGPGIRILAVGAVSLRKGYDLLVEALSALQDRDWHLTIVGSLTHQPATVERLRAQIAAAGLEPRVTLAGEVSDTALEQLQAFADLFVSASRYEGYGMALAEALARGLPLVIATGGAAGSTVPDAAALKVPSGDVASLREALGRALDDPDLRASLARASWMAGQKLPRWSETARRIAGVIRDLAPRTKENSP